MAHLPIIVCVALAVSLFEALTILPAHLAHGAKVSESSESSNIFVRLTNALRRWQLDHIQTPIRNKYERLLRVAASYRYVTLSALVAVALIVGGMVAGGIVKQTFLQKMDSETLTAKLEMGIGTPMSETQEAAEYIEDAALALTELRSIYTLIGAELSDDGNLSAPQSHMAQLFLELTDSEIRERNSNEIITELRTKTSNIPGVEKLKYGSIQGGPGGAPVHLEISGDEVDDLLGVSEIVKGKLAEYDGVFDIVDDFDAGRREVQIELFDSARALGLTTQLLATQVRSAFFGFEAKKIQRGREDVKIMVRYPEHARREIYDIEKMRIATPSGRLVPFSEVARLTEGTGFSTIRRKDQSRTVTVTADVDDTVADEDTVIATLSKSFPEIQQKYPSVDLEFGGRKLENRKAFASLKSGMVAALIAIYVILASLFKSYIQPLIVLSVVPFGLIGVVLGHAALGYPMTMLSMIGTVALTGIVVNDSMIVVTFINRAIAAGTDPFTAAIEGGKQTPTPHLADIGHDCSWRCPPPSRTVFSSQVFDPNGNSDLRRIGIRYRAHAHRHSVPLSNRGRPEASVRRRALC